MNKTHSANALMPRAIAEPLARLRDEVDTMLGDFPSPRRMFDWSGHAFPAVDIKETEQAFQVAAETPGYKRDELSLSCVGDCLTIKGKRAEQAEREEGGLIINEREEGEFERQLTLPGKVDAKNISATLEDGVLQVTLPKQDDPARTPIPIDIR